LSKTERRGKIGNNPQNKTCRAIKIAKQGGISVISRNLFLTALEKTRALWYNKRESNKECTYEKDDSGYAYAL
jgi:hypothetical protein